MKIKNAKRHEAGHCFVPNNFVSIPLLAPAAKFFAPKRVDCRDYCTPTENQGEKPWCAAYAVANWAEAMIWRRDDKFEQIQPGWIYQYAKEIDGMPEADGTTLTASLEALRGSLFDRDACKVKVVGPSRNHVKYALHKFGLIVAGFNITEEWYRCTSHHPVIENDEEANIGGHACIICGYSDADGVYLQNSWGADGFGNYGFATMRWECFDRQFMYGAVLSNVLDGLTVNT